MRKTVFQRAAIVVLGIVTGTVAARAEELDAHLVFLQPLLNKTWVGGYVNSPQNRDLEITQRWDPILDGKAVRRKIDVPAVPFSEETYFYWDRKGERVAFLALNTRGITGSGTAVKDGTTVTLEGQAMWPDRTMEFRRVLEVLPDGKLKDLFFHMGNGEWTQDHQQEFGAVPPGNQGAHP